MPGEDINLLRQIVDQLIELNAGIRDLQEAQSKSAKVAERSSAEESLGGSVGGTTASSASLGGSSGSAFRGGRQLAGGISSDLTNPFMSLQSSAFGLAQKGFEAAGAAIPFVGSPQLGQAAFNVSGAREAMFAHQSAEAQTRAVFTRYAAAGGTINAESVKGFYKRAKARAERIAQGNRKISSVIGEQGVEDVAGAVGASKETATAVGNIYSLLQGWSTILGATAGRE